MWHRDLLFVDAEQSGVYEVDAPSKVLGADELESKSEQKSDHLQPDSILGMGRNFTPDGWGRGNEALDKMARPHEDDDDDDPVQI